MYILYLIKAPSSPLALNSVTKSSISKLFNRKGRAEGSSRESIPIIPEPVRKIHYEARSAFTSEKAEQDDSDDDKINDKRHKKSMSMTLADIFNAGPDEKKSTNLIRSASAKKATSMSFSTLPTAPPVPNAMDKKIPRKSPKTERNFEVNKAPKRSETDVTKNVKRPETEIAKLLKRLETTTSPESSKFKADHISPPLPQSTTVRSNPTTERSNSICDLKNDISFGVESFIPSVSFLPPLLPPMMIMTPVGTLTGQGTLGTVLTDSILASFDLESSISIPNYTMEKHDSQNARSSSASKIALESKVSYISSRFSNPNENNQTNNALIFDVNHVQSVDVPAISYLKYDIQPSMHHVSIPSISDQKTKDSFISKKTDPNVAATIELLQAASFLKDNDTSRVSKSSAMDRSNLATFSKPGHTKQISQQSKQTNHISYPKQTERKSQGIQTLICDMESFGVQGDIEIKFPESVPLYVNPGLNASYLEIVVQIISDFIIAQSLNELISANISPAIIVNNDGSHQLSNSLERTRSGKGRANLSNYEVGRKAAAEDLANKFLMDPVNSISDMGSQYNGCDYTTSDMELNDPAQNEIEIDPTQTEETIPQSSSLESEEPLFIEMLINENSRLNQEITELRLQVAQEKAKSEQFKILKESAEGRFEQLARLAHRRLGNNNEG